MAARKRKSTRKTAKSRKGLRGSGVKCTRVRYKGHTRTVCRSKKTGKLVKASGTQRKKASGSCPAKWRGKKVYRAKGGRCYVKLKKGGARFVSKRS